MARLKNFTRDVKLEVRLDPNSTQVTVFGAKAGKTFDVPDGYYANYCIKKLGCVLITPESEAPTPDAPRPVTDVVVEVAAPQETPVEEAPEEPIAAVQDAEAEPAADHDEPAASADDQQGDAIDDETDVPAEEPPVDEPAADDAAPAKTGRRGRKAKQ